MNFEPIKLLSQAMRRIFLIICSYFNLVKPASALL
jgi:hypothetical protein